MFVTFKPIPRNLSVNNRGVKKKVVIVYDEDAIKDEIEDMYELLEKLDKLDWFHAHIISC